MPKTPAHRMEHFERLCRERGLPLTVQRRGVLDVILQREDHPTADEIHALLEEKLPGVSRTSVYRILEMLVEVGMVEKVCHPGSAARFDPKLHRHHHLVCLSCERMIDVEIPSLDQMPLPDVRAHQFQIDDYHIHFRGICSTCRKKQKAAKTSDRKPKRRRSR